MNRAGFTLAETIVAMCLFAMAAVVLCQAAVNARNALLRIEYREEEPMRINWIRDDILAITDRKKLEEGGEMEFPRHVLKTPKEGAEEEALGDAVRARWEVEIFPTTVLDVHQLNIEVTLEQGEEMAAPLTGSYYVYRPGWYETDDRGSLLEEKQDAWERLQLEKGL